MIVRRRARQANREIPDRTDRTAEKGKKGKEEKRREEEEKVVTTILDSRISLEDQGINQIRLQDEGINLQDGENQMEDEETRKEKNNGKDETVLAEEFKRIYLEKLEVII